MTKPRFSLVPTDEFVDVNGTPARIWRGASHGGTPVELIVVAIGVDTDKWGTDKASFDATFTELTDVSVAVVLPPVEGSA